VLVNNLFRYRSRFRKKSKFCYYRLLGSLQEFTRVYQLQPRKILFFPLKKRVIACYNSPRMDILVLSCYFVAGYVDWPNWTIRPEGPERLQSFLGGRHETVKKTTEE